MRESLKNKERTEVQGYAGRTLPRHKVLLYLGF
jgi:hypothetical protein